MARITINGNSLDPLAQRDLLEAVAPQAADASQSDYILVQTSGSLSSAQRQQLTDVGAEIQEYVPDDTYLCRYKPADLAPVRALPFVAWAGAYLRGFKIPPALKSATTDASSGVLFAAAGPSPSRKPRVVDVVLHEGVDANSGTLKERLAAAARVDPDELTSGTRKVRLTVQEGDLDSLAALDEVRHIEEVPTRQLFNNVARVLLNADVVVNGTAYQGEGQTIAVADTGFDEGSTTNVHPAFTGRVATLYALGRPNPAKTDDPHGHGTHVAGSALGDGTSTSMGGAIQGTAPRATLVLQSTLDSQGHLGGLPADLHDLFEPPYDNDQARVHTNSWGAATPGLPYDSSAQEIDDVVWARPDLVICFAAGNDGTDQNGNGVIDAGSIGSQSAAKNCITVGASESDRPEFAPSYGTYWPPDFPANPINDDHQADKPAGLVAFSSRGPTKENRIKPDVVAPGTCILSTLSRAVSSPSTDFGTSSDNLFFYESGTSMATPLVAGCVAVIRETLVRHGTSNPTAALVKAMLINGAVELTGQYSPTEAGASPNNNSGWGRVDLQSSIIIPGDNPSAGFGEGDPLSADEEVTFSVDIPESLVQHEDDEQRPCATTQASGVTFKITLAWTDPPGAALQNDLDLIVRAPNGDEQHGNRGAVQDFDRLNNVEQIVWTNMQGGKIEVTIRAFRITSFPQPYAYAWRLS
jgi:serine protease AprX